MQLLEAAGLPPGVINLVLGDGPMVSDVALNDPRLAASTSPVPPQPFSRSGPGRRQHQQLSRYPRLVGETGGKDFVVAHSSADPDVLTTALIRGAFDFQGQKCSAASRAFVPKSVWSTMGDDFLAKVSDLAYGDVTDFSNYGGAGHRPAGLRPQCCGNRPGQGDRQHRHRGRRQL